MGTTIGSPTSSKRGREWDGEREGVEREGETQRGMERREGGREGGREGWRGGRKGEGGRMREGLAFT